MTGGEILKPQLLFLLNNDPKYFSVWKHGVSFFLSWLPSIFLLSTEQLVYWKGWPRYIKYALLFHRCPHGGDGLFCCLEFYFWSYGCTLCACDLHMKHEWLCLLKRCIMGFLCRRYKWASVHKCKCSKGYCKEITIVKLKVVFLRCLAWAEYLESNLCVQVTANCFSLVHTEPLASLFFHLPSTKGRMLGWNCYLLHIGYEL